MMGPLPSFPKKHFGDRPRDLTSSWALMNPLDTSLTPATAEASLTSTGNTTKSSSHPMKMLPLGSLPM